MFKKKTRCGPVKFFHTKVSQPCRLKCCIVTETDPAQTFETKL